MKRPTIRDVAAAAGVSTAAVSHAMNGRPNIPPTTAARIRSVADELGWRPASAGRRLSGVVSTVGLVITRSQDAFERDAGFVHILASISAEVSARELTLVLAFFDDIEATLAAHERWWQEQRVDGFILLDPRVNDERVELLARLNAPAVTIGRSPDPERVPEVVVSDERNTAEIMEHLRSRGHARCVRFSDPDSIVAVKHRNEMFHEAHLATFREPGVLIVLDPPVESRKGLQEAIDRVGTPIAVIVDNELMASRVFADADALGLLVPGDVSVVSWEDSWVCDILRPRLTALRPPLEESAREAIDVLDALLRSGSATSRRVSPRTLIVRDSVATL